MNPEQIRARLLEIQAQLDVATQVEDGQTYSAEQITQINDLNEEFKALTEQLETAEKIASMKAGLAETAGRKVAPATSASQRIVVGADPKDRFGGFATAGEFFKAVHGAAHGTMAKQFQNSTMYERNGEDGGFLVPEEVSQAILKKLDSSESLMAETTKLAVSGNSLTLNVDEAQPWNQGITAYWLAEGAPITPSKNSLKQVSFRLQKVGALVTATDELLEDATALESYVKAAAGAALMHKINGAIISGNGVGKPNGILGSGFTVEVAEESGQDNDTIVARNVIKMYSRMLPGARAGAKWYVNAQAEEQLLTLRDDNDNFIYLAPGSQMNQSPYGLLLGRPVIPMMSALPALGDAGDLLFANLSYYYMIAKAGVKTASSIHVNFDREQTSFRFTMRLDGKCPFTSPVTTEFGSHQMSGFVKLQDR